MADLQDLLERLADEAGPPRGAHAVFDRASALPAAPFRPRPRWLAVVAVTSATVLLAAVFVLVGRSSSRRIVVSEVPTTPPPATAPNLTGIARIDTPVLAADSGQLWLTGGTGGNGPAELYEIDEATNRAIASIALPDNGPYQVAPDAGSVWIASQQGEQSAHIFKVDSATRRVVATITTTKDSQLAVTPTNVWAVDGSGVLLRIDPATARVMQSITLPGGGYAAKFISAGPLGVWLSSPYDGSILRLDETIGAIREVAHVGTSAGPLLQAGGYVWVLNNGAGPGSSSLVALSRSTGQIVRTVALSVHVVTFSTTGQDLWLATIGALQLLEYLPATQGYRSAALLYVDPVNGTTSPVDPRTGIGSFPSAVAFDPATATLWAAATVRSTLSLVRSAPRSA